MVAGQVLSTMAHDPYFERMFLVNVTPIRTTHQADLRILRTKDGRQFIGKTSKSAIKQWMDVFTLQAKRFAPDRPFEGPLELCLYFGFPLIKSDKGQASPMTTKPDFDNLAKSVCDGLTKLGFWNDDSQIVYGKVVKYRTPLPFVGVEVRPVDWLDGHYDGALRARLERTLS